MTDLNERIKAAASVTRHSVDVLLSHLGDVVREPDEIEVGTNAVADAIGVSCSLIADTWLDRRLQNLANAISGSQALAKSAAARGSKVMRVERGTGPKGVGTRGLAGLFSRVYHLEPRKLLDDLAVAHEIGIPASVCQQLMTTIAQVGVTATTLRVTVYSGPPAENMQIELGAPAPANLFERLGDTSEASRFLRALEPRGTMLVWIGATQTGLLPAPRVEYLQPDLDEAIAIAGKFGEMASVYSFVAALEARTAASIAVNLGATALGPAWLSANL